jgi:glycosyl transferase family 87
MEETVAAYRDRWLAAEGAPARWGLRLLPLAFVLVIASTFTLAAVGSNLTVQYLGWDTRAYYDALRSSDPYAGAAVGEIGSFLYPPPFLQVLRPAGQLPWPVFLFGWTALLTGAAVTMLRRVPHRYRTMWPLLLFLAGADIWAGNINLFLAFGAVVALTWPAAWAGLALTKVTPGVGALWHGFRGHWPEFGLAVTVSLIGAGLSFVAAPALWGDWLSIIFGEDPGGPYATSVPVPLIIRVPVAVALLWWAARTDRPWLVPIACMAALPVIWFNGLSMLLGAAALIDHDRPLAVAEESA